MGGAVVNIAARCPVDADARRRRGGDRRARGEVVDAPSCSCRVPDHPVGARGHSRRVGWSGWSSLPGALDRRRIARRARRRSIAVACCLAALLVAADVRSSRAPSCLSDHAECSSSIGTRRAASWPPTARCLEEHARLRRSCTRAAPPPRFVCRLLSRRGAATWSTRSSPPSTRSSPRSSLVHPASPVRAGPGGLRLRQRRRARTTAWPRAAGAGCRDSSVGSGDVALPISRQTIWEFLALVPSAAPRHRLGYLAVDPRRVDDPDVAPRRRDRRDPRPRRRGVVEPQGHRPVRRGRSTGPRRVATCLAGQVRRAIQALLAGSPRNLECVGRLSDDELRGCSGARARTCSCRGTRRSVSPWPKRCCAVASP